jgi:quinolinate synthase
MKLITLEKVLWSLEEMVVQVRVPDELRDRAQKPVQKMLSLR